MGNRAVIAFEEQEIGIYLHWNGGRDSVEGFLLYCKMRDFRDPSSDCYGIARCVQVIANFFGGTTSIGVDVLTSLDTDNGDNGVFWTRGWKITKREHFNGREQQHTIETRIEFMKFLDSQQPTAQQIFKDLSDETIKQLIEKASVTC